MTKEDEAVAEEEKEEEEKEEEEDSEASFSLLFRCRSIAPRSSGGSGG